MQLAAYKEPSMKMTITIPSKAGWNDAEREATRKHVGLMFTDLAPDVDDGYSLDIQVFTSEERTQVKEDYDLAYEPFAFLTDYVGTTTSSYREHWFVIPERNNELVTSEGDWDLVHNPGADPTI